MLMVNQLIGFAGGSSNLVNATALLHFDGADASTTFTDEKGRTFTASGNAQIDTAQSKFGGASGLFDGTGDYVTAASSTDFALAATATLSTISFWARFAATGGTEIMIERFDGAAGWTLYKTSGDKVELYNGSTTITGATSLSENTWYHIEVTSDGTTRRIFVNGTQDASSTNAGSELGGSQALNIGSRQGSSFYFNGWMDELLIIKGQALHTANFVVPTEPYTTT